MRKVNFTTYVRYKFDNLLSRGVVTLVVGLFLLSVLFVIFIALLATFLQVGVGNDQHHVSFLTLFWSSLTHSLDGGVISTQSGSWQYILLMLVATLGGMVLLSILIGVLNSGISKKLDELRRGHSLVIEDGHTIILGWSPQIFYIIAELVTANQGKKHACISILAEKDKVDMEDEIRMKLGETGTTKIVCRRGNPIDLTDLEIINPHTAKSIIILPPETDDSDSQMIKMILAITNNPQRRQERYHIVAAIRDPKNLEVAHLVGKNEVSIILVEDVISKIIAQTCRQPGLSVVFNELLDFKRNKLYFHEENALIGKPFSKALFAYQQATPIGIRYADGRSQLNPPLETRIDRGDILILVAEDELKLLPSNQPEQLVDATVIRTSAKKFPQPERTLILGWNRQAITIIRELNNYVSKGSQVHIVADASDAEQIISEECINLDNLIVTFKKADSSSRRTLDSLNCHTYHHIIILSYANRKKIQEADARTIFTLLHLRDLADHMGHPFTMVSQVLDVRNRELVNVTRADDFVVSDKLNSLMLSQVSENKDLSNVFEDLFRSEGSEVYLKPASDYVELRKPVNFYTVVESARRRGEIAIGCRLLSRFDEDALEQGVIVNPEKSKLITFFEEDKIIVLAEDDH